MYNKARKLYKKHRPVIINWAQVLGILTIISGLIVAYWQTHTNASNIQSNTKWIGDNLKDKSNQISELQRQVDLLNYEVQELQNKNKR